MTTAFTKKYREEHSGGKLQFTFYCDICHREYASPVFEAPIEQGLFQKWKLQKAYVKVFEEAQSDAMEHFNRCIACGQWVCDEDFNRDFGCCAECNSDDIEKLNKMR